MALTFFDVKAANPKDKSYRLSDGDGLYLQIQPNGSKLWRFRYRHAGIEKMLGIGPYPAVSIADARQGKNSAGQIGYTGPMPPVGHGEHHYHFQLFALDAPLQFEHEPDRDDLVAAISGHVLASGEVIGTYERK